VLKKWLSYRETDVLGRPLTPTEAREVTGMVRRLAAIVLMQPELDTNYRAVVADAIDWGSLRGSQQLDARAALNVNGASRRADDDETEQRSRPPRLTGRR
jgi:NAD(P)H-dependent FMN reductase